MTFPGNASELRLQPLAVLAVRRRAARLSLRVPRGCATKQPSPNPSRWTAFDPSAANSRSAALVCYALSPVAIHAFPEGITIPGTLVGAPSPPTIRAGKPDDGSEYEHRSDSVHNRPSGGRSRHAHAFGGLLQRVVPGFTTTDWEANSLGSGLARADPPSRRFFLGLVLMPLQFK